MARKLPSLLVSQIDWSDPELSSGDGSARYAIEYRRDNPGCDQDGCGDPACQDLYHVNFKVIAAVKEYRRKDRARRGLADAPAPAWWQR